MFIELVLEELGVEELGVEEFVLGEFVLGEFVLEASCCRLCVSFECGVWCVVCVGVRIHRRRRGSSLQF